MSFLIILLLPFTLAAGCFPLRRYRRLIALASLGTTLIEGWFLLSVSVGEPARLLGTTLLLQPYDRLLVCVLLLVLAGASLGMVAGFMDGRGAPWLLVMEGLLLGAVLVEPLPMSILLLMAAGVASVPLGLDMPAHPVSSAVLMGSAIMKLLVTFTLGGSLLLVGYALHSAEASGAPPAALGLQLAGITLWLGLMPVQGVLAGFPKPAALPVLGIVAGLLQVVAMLLVMRLVRVTPGMLDMPAARPLLVGLACFTVVGASWLGSGSPQRVVALLLAANMGQLLLGLALGSQAGLRSLLVGLPVHTLAVALITGCGHILQTRRAEAARYRISIAVLGFTTGLLLLCGLPPLAGWAAKAWLWQAASQHDPVLFVLVVLGHTALVLQASALGGRMVFRPMFNGQAAPTLPTAVPGARWPRIPALVWVAVISLLSLAAGVYPRLWLGPVEVALADLRLAIMVLP